MVYRAVVIKIEDDATASRNSFHPVFSETVADNACNGAYVNVRILAALACHRPGAGLAGKWPPKYDSTVDDQFVLGPLKTKVNDVGIGSEFASGDEALANERLTQEAGQFGRLTN